MNADPRTAELAKDWMRSRLLPIPADVAGARDREGEMALARQVAQAFHQFPDVLQLILELTLFKPTVDWRATPDQRDAYTLITQGRHEVATSLLYYLLLADHQGETHAPSAADFFRGASAGRRDGGGGGDAGDAADPSDWAGPGVALR
jgi:hypothetical protein